MTKNNHKEFSRKRLENSVAIIRRNKFYSYQCVVFSKHQPPANNSTHHGD
jgi:hypothetical protein